MNLREVSQCPEKAPAAGGDPRPAEVPQGGRPEDGALVGPLRAKLRRQAGGVGQGY